MTLSHQNLYIMKKNPANLSEVFCKLQLFLIIKKIQTAPQALVSAKTKPEFRNDFQTPTAISA